MKTSKQQQQPKNGTKKKNKQKKRSTTCAKTTGEKSPKHKQSLHLSPAAGAYLHSLCDPWGSRPTCVPDFPTIPSRKVKVFSKGFFSVGALQLGSVLALPIAAASQNLDCLCSTQATYALNTVPRTGANTINSTSNADYNSAVIGTGLVNYRVVSAGLRIRYAGTELNRGGTIVGVEGLQHQDLTGLTFNQLDSMPNSRRFHPMGGKWYKLMYCPVLVNELNWSVAPAQLSVSGGYMCFAVMGQTGDLYEYEFYVNLEYNGTNVRGLTPGMSDPTGLAVVHSGLNSTGMMPTDKPVETFEQTMQKSVEKAANYTVTSLVDAAIEFDPIVEVAETASWVADEVFAGLAVLGL